MKKLTIFLLTLISIGWAQVETFQQQLELETTDSIKSRLMFQIAAKLKITDPVTSAIYAENAYKIAREQNLIHLSIRILRLKTELEREFGNYTQSQKDCQTGLELSAQYGDTTLLPALTWEMGNLYCRTGDYNKATAYYDMSIQLCIKHANPLQLMKTLNGKAVLLSDHNQYQEAVQHYYLSLKIATNIKNEGGIASVKLNLATLYFKMGNYAYARQLTEEAAVIATKLGDKRHLTNAISNLASIDFITGNLTAALQGYQRSLKMNEETHDLRGIMFDVGNIAGVLATMGRFEEASVWLKRSMSLEKAADNKIFMAQTYINLSDVYSMQGDYQKAVLYADSGKYATMKLGLLEDLSHAYNNLFAAYESLHKYKEAFENFKLYAALKDSLFSIDLAQKAQELKIQYEVAAQQKQMELLEEKEKVNNLKVQQKNYLIFALIAGVSVLISLVIVIVVVLVSRARRKEAIFARKKAELEQQSLRSQMNPHFIFNSLNSIQRLYVEGKTNVANEYMADFSILMRKILDNSSKEKITLKEEINTLSLYLQMEKLRCGDILEYQIKVDDGIDQLNTSIPPMIIQPFVENSIWHGILPKKEKGKVVVHISQTDHALFCSIEDNGVGFSEKTSDHQSKGISLTEKRLNTKVTIVNLSPGTRISFRII